MSGKKCIFAEKIIIKKKARASGGHSFSTSHKV